LSENTELRLLKITANGPYFCAGGDLNWFINAKSLSETENIADASKLAYFLHTLNEFPKPTLAQVQGPAFGGGVGLVACCDFAIASQSASFCLTEVKLGLVPATISPYVLAAIGSRQLRRYALSAEKFSAEEAQSIGLVHSVVKDDDLHETVQNLTNHLLKNAPRAMSITKKLIQELSPQTTEIINKTAALLAKVRVSAEAQEGIKAFLEKK
jgi:methylglutaconyl-CoA hydratase